MQVPYLVGAGSTLPFGWGGYIYIYTLLSWWIGTVVGILAPPPRPRPVAHYRLGGDKKHDFASLDPTQSAQGGVHYSAETKKEDDARRHGSP